MRKALVWGIVVVALAGSLGGEARARSDAGPSVVQPANITLPVTSPGGLTTTVDFTVDATDPDYAESALTIFCNWGSLGKTFPAGSTSEVFSVGTWTVSCYAADPAGRTSSTVSFTLNVAPYGSPTGPPTPPSIIQPANVTVPVTSPGGLTTNVGFTVDATDPNYAESALTIHCLWGIDGKTFPAGSTSQVFSVGTWTVSCYASDPPGNTSSSVSFTINVAPYGSPTGPPTPPSVVQPANVTVPLTSPSGLTTTVDFTVDATDPNYAESALTIHCTWGNLGKTFPAGSTSQVFSVGTWTVSCYASDPPGNTSPSVSFTINVTPYGSATSGPAATGSATTGGGTTGATAGARATTGGSAAGGGAGTTNGSASATQGSSSSTSGSTSGTSLQSVRGPVTVTIPVALGTVHLADSHPAITLTAHAAGSTTLVLTLMNAKGKAIAHWTRSAKAGRVTMHLSLPRGVQKAGHDTLRITQRGGRKAATVPVTLRV